MKALETSIPILRLWTSLVVPLQGEVTDRQADRLFDEVLRAIERFGTSGLVLDLSGVLIMDSHLCSILARIATAAGFMGTRCIVTGLTPEIVMTLQAMDIMLSGIETTLSMEAALERLGIRIDEDRTRARDMDIEELLAADDAVPAALPHKTTP